LTGDEDGSDEYLHNRRKTVSKAIDKDDESDEPVVKTDRRKKLDKKDNDADMEAEGYGKGKKMRKEAIQARPGTKAQQRAFDKADKTAKPKDKVSLKPMPSSLSRKMKDESIGRTAGNSSYHNLQKAKRMAAKDGHDYDKLPAYDRTHEMATTMISYQHMIVHMITIETIMITKLKQQEKIKRLAIL